VRGVTVIDDYAHHPAEVAATLTEARSLHPGRLWGVFQPHLYSRTERFAKEFGEALAVADRVVVTDIYGSREAPRPGITGELIVSAAKSAGTAEVFYVPHRVDVASEVAAMVSEGDLVVIMGAGDITVSATELLREIAL
jgi:UDP-N-acetylmuramate--alanine ligase